MRHRLTESLASWIVRNHIAVVVGGLLLAVLAVGWSWDRVKLDANTDSLMGDDRGYVTEYKQFLREFGDLEYAWIVVQTNGNMGQAQHAVDLLEARLLPRNEPTIQSVNGKISAPEQMVLATWAMETRDLEGLVEGRDALPLLASGAGTGEVLSDALRKLGRLRSAGLWMPRAEAERVGAAAMLELEAIAAAAPDAPPFIGAPAEQHYLASPSGNLLFVGVMPNKDFGTFEVIDQPLGRIREAVAAVQAQVPEVTIGLTGKPVLQADELATTNSDMNVSSIVGLVLCTILFMAVFRGFKLPLLAVVAFLVGAALTYAAAALFFGRLNLLSIVFMLVLVGVGLDYGIHMVARYVEGRRHLAPRDAITYMMRTAVPSNVAGALTSAGVFLLAWFTEFQGLRELGVVSGVGLLLTLGAMVLILPALLVIFDAKLRKSNRAAPESGAKSFFLNRESYDHKLTTRAAWVAVAVSMVTAAGAATYGLTHVRFESNLLKLQASGLDSVEWEHRVIEDSAAASWFGAAVVDQMDKIPVLVTELRGGGVGPDGQVRPVRTEIGEIHSVLDAVKMETPARAALRAQFASAVEAAPTRPRKIPEWGHRDLRSAAGDVRFLAGFAEREAPAVAEHMHAVGEQLMQLSELLNPRHHSADEIALVRAHIDATVARAAVGLQQMADGARRTLRDALPMAVRARMMSPSGKFLVMIHPAQDVWEREPLGAYVAAMEESMRHASTALGLQGPGLKATGVPSTVFESMKSMERSFALQALLATLLVITLLWLDLRNVAQVLAALASLAIGVAWTVGVMALLGATFNLANFFAVPILIGLGIDSAIHMTHRAHEGALDHGFGSTRHAVIVTAMTTTIGFGALLLAHHQGLRSLGIAMSVGSVCCLVSAVWTLPAILRIIGLRPKHASLRLVPAEERAKADAA